MKQSLSASGEGRGQAGSTATAGEASSRDEAVYAANEALERLTDLSLIDLAIVPDGLCQPLREDLVDALASADALTDWLGRRQTESPEMRRKTALRLELAADLQRRAALVQQVLRQLSARSLP